jgi:hypothetical protein
MSACVVPITTLQSQPIRSGACPGCRRQGSMRLLTQSQAILGPGQLRIGGIA